jgi:hypothetical protein
MRSLTVTFAMGLQKGRVQLERYHLHVLKGLRETKNALYYVLFNQQKHERGISSKIDEYSSVLSLDRALVIIRKFAMEKKMVLKIGFQDWKGDQMGSYLLREATHQL